MDYRQNNLRSAKEVLDLLGIDFYMCCGATLGYYREGKLIPHDPDVDIAIRIEDYQPDIVKHMERAGFSVWRIFGTPERGLEASFKRDGVKLDIFFMYEEKDHVWHSVWDKGVMIKYKYPKPKLKEVEFEGVKVKMPQKAYMIAQYGKGWNKPNKDWKWNNSPKNIDDSDYWKKFYQRKHTDKPSDFAVFVNEWLKPSKILELGAGNGRDSYYLAKKHQVTALDNAVKPKANGVKFIKTDLREYMEQNDCEDVVYARFFLHAIPETLEDELLDWVKNIIAIEARVSEVPKSDHFRRYADTNKLAKKLTSRGFKILHIEIGRGLAKYKNEDPEVVRIIAQR